MRIKELCESIDVELEKPVFEDPNDPHGLGFDLADDLLFFMHHDDDAYRRNTYPAIMKAKDHLNGGKQTDYKLFGDAVKEAYTKYKEKFNIRELPAELDEDTLNKICEHLHAHETKKIGDGHYEGK